MSKVLLTGTGGFIFSNFIRKAIYEKAPYTFISIDKISGDANTLYSHKNHPFHIADIRDVHVIDKIFQFERPDIVIHGAAESSVDGSLKDPNAFITSNVLGTQNLINASLKHNVKRFIYISTDEVYGHLKESDSSWTEESPINPRNPYSASKASGELLVKAAYESHGLTYNITRSSNNYGPRQTTDKLIPRVIKSIINKEPIPVYGAGAQIRDWMHVNDNCDGILSVLANGKPNETYNISANQELSNIEVVQKICNIMNEGHSLITNIKDPRGNGHDFRYSLDNSKIKTLGWDPSIKFKDGIYATIQWYKINNWFLK